MLVFSQSSAAAWSDLIFDGGWENCKATGRDSGEDMVAMFETGYRLSSFGCLSLVQETRVESDYLLVSVVVA